MIKTIDGKDFLQYGRPLEALDCNALLEALEEMPFPDHGTVYAPSHEALEALSVFSILKEQVYGGLDIQIGYCNGHNTKLNCLEYHRGPEVIIPATEIVLMLARCQDIQDGKLDTKKVEFFAVPEGRPVMLYETTLHYSPAHGENGFRTAIVLLRNTNTAREASLETGEGRLLAAKNKWLMAHPEACEARDGAYIGLTGKNPDLTNL